MGYNTSTRSIVRVENYLLAMLNSNEDLEWTPPPGVTTFQLSFWIRQGIIASARYDKYKQYSGLKEKYIIKQRGDKSVRAELRLTRLTLIQEEMGTLMLDGPTEPIEVIGAAIKHKGSKMFFPNADPDIALFTWAKKNGYSIICAGEGLTLTKEEVGDLEWTP